MCQDVANLPIQALVTWGSMRVYGLTTKHAEMRPSWIAVTEQGRIVAQGKQAVDTSQQQAAALENHFQLRQMLL